MPDPLSGNGQSTALLRLMQLASPALPVGGFAYSHGLEWAVEAGWLRTGDDAGDWLMGLFAHLWCRVDVPILARLTDAEAAADDASLAHWSALLAAMRGTAELAAEDRRMGLALARLLVELDVPRAARWQGHPHAGLAPLWACAAVAWEIPLPQAALGLLWSIAEQQVGAAVKLVPLGQSQGQRILLELGRRLPGWCAAGLALPDEAIGAQTPGLALASSHHETQYTRLFRS